MRLCLLLECRFPSIVLIRPARAIHSTIILSGWHRPPRLIQHALALFDLSRQTNLHHRALKTPAFFQLPPQIPNDALSVCLNCVCLGLLQFFLWALCCYCAACCPPSQCSQPFSCALLHSDCSFRILSHLLGAVETCNRMVQFSNQLLCGGVDLCSLIVGKVLVRRRK
jgi:hypothetical protein